MNQAKLMRYGILGFIILMLFVFLTNSTFLTIKPGEAGVLFKRFSGGLDKENLYTQGFHVIAPWNSIIIYNVRDMTMEESMEVLSNDGLNIKVAVTVRYSPIQNKIGDLHEKFGEAYKENLIKPEVRSAVRKVIGDFTPEELYSTKRDEVQTRISAELQDALNKNFISLKAALIRDIELPPRVQEAIEEKLKAEQMALKYEYLLDQEKQEAERKKIEAGAKAEANRILNASLTDKILQDKGIEATLELSKSPNSKVIVVGGGDGGLPIILGDQ